ncbi:MAG: hypothetical protein LUI87_08565 [Lachnospiraceae bacterium]|nr:hypothetical protein [Lachnospiraceae bacterium]
MLFGFLRIIVGLVIMAVFFLLIASGKQGIACLLGAISVSLFQAFLGEEGTIAFWGVGSNRTMILVALFAGGLFFLFMDLRFVSGYIAGLCAPVIGILTMGIISPENVDGMLRAAFVPMMIVAVFPLLFLGILFGGND